jgi:hypothetical protein
VAVDFDAKLTDLAAEILRDAAQVYGPGETERLIVGFNPVLSGTGMFAGPAATGSLPAITGSFTALTGSLPAATGSLTQAFTSAFKALVQQPEEEPEPTLRQVFRLPPRLPGIRLLPERELGAMARSVRTMGALDALARWLGRDGRLVTVDDELTAGDAATACSRLGIRPEYLPYLWEYALTAGWFELVDSDDGGRTWAVIGQTAWRWAEGDDPGALHVWAAVFAAVTARVLDVAAMTDEGASRRLSFQGQGVALAVMLFLARRNGMTVREVTDLVREGAIGEQPPARVRRAWEGWVRAYGDPARLVLTELAALGAVSLPRPADGPVVLTGLGCWALRELLRHEGVMVPVLAVPSPGMSAADLVALSDSGSDAEFAAVFGPWVRDRGPDRAARELFVFAGSSGPHGRLAAINLVRRIGVPAHRAWRDAMKRPELRGYARITLSMMADRLPESTLPLVLEPDPEDLTGVAADLLELAASGDQPDPDEIAAQFAEAVPAGEEGWVFGLMAQSSNPQVARFLSMLSAYHPDRQIARDARKAARAMAKRRRPRTAGHGRAPARTGGR